MVNLIPNPSYDVNAAGTINLANTNSGRFIPVFHSAPAACLVSWLAGATNWGVQIVELDNVTRIAISPSTTYIFSAWLYSGSPPGVEYRIQVSERDAGNNPVGSHATANTPLPSTTWTEFSLSFTSASDAASVVLETLGLNGAGTYAFVQDDLLLEEVPSAGGTIWRSMNQPQGNTWRYA